MDGKIIAMRKRVSTTGVLLALISYLCMLALTTIPHVHEGAGVISLLVLPARQRYAWYLPFMLGYGFQQNVLVNDDCPICHLSAAAVSCLPLLGRHFARLPG